MASSGQTRNTQRLAGHIGELSGGVGTFTLSPTYKRANGQQAYGVIAQCEIKENANIMADRNPLIAGLPNDRTCLWCFRTATVESAIVNDCTFCSVECQQQADETFHHAAACETGHANETLSPPSSPEETGGEKLTRLLLSRLLTTIIKSKQRVPPLEHGIVCDVDLDFDHSDVVRFSFGRDIRDVLEFLQRQGVDIYRNHDLDIWIIKILEQKMMKSMWQYEGRVAIGRIEHLFNHSCDPNVNEVVNITTGEIEFVANGDIAVGEELCISYKFPLPDDYKKRQFKLRDWFVQCQCPRCENSRQALPDVAERDLEPELDVDTDTDEEEDI